MCYNLVNKKGVLSMKVLGCLGCLLSFWGIIWGIFIRPFVWLALVGMVLMGVCLLFGDDEN